MKRILFCLNILAIIFVSAIIGVYYYNEYTYQKETESLINQFNILAKSTPLPIKTDSSITTGSTATSPPSKESVDKNLIGRLKIPVINIDYPLLASTTEKNLRLGITKFFGPGIETDTGNTVLAGHNLRKGHKFFTDLYKVKLNDLITITDMEGITYNYKITDIYVVTPDNEKPLSQMTGNEHWITLITCTEQGTKRLIVTAKLIK